MPCRQSLSLSLSLSLSNRRFSTESNLKFLFEFFSQKIRFVFLKRISIEMRIKASLFLQKNWSMTEFFYSNWNHFFAQNTSDPNLFKFERNNLYRLNKPFIRLTWICVSASYDILCLLHCRAIEASYCHFEITRNYNVLELLFKLWQGSNLDLICDWGQHLVLLCTKDTLIVRLKHKWDICHWKEVAHFSIN